MSTQTRETYKDEFGFTWEVGDSFSGFMWLSFACPDEGFLGVAIVRSNNAIDACKLAYDMGINPGGGVYGTPIPTSDVGKVILEDHTDRLLDSDEALFLQGAFSE